MSPDLIDQIKVFEVYYSLGVTRSLSKLYEELHRRYKHGVPSEGSLKKWSGRFKWQDKIVIRDNAAYEGVAEKMTAAQVDVKIDDLAQLDQAHDEIEAIKAQVMTALQSDQGVAIIMPETTQDTAALCNVVSRLNTTQVKIIETKRKIRGDPDKIEVAANVKLTEHIDPALAATIGAALTVETEEE